MFGRRSVEVLEPPRELSFEEREQLYQEALARIEDIDGVDYLDGWKLTPDDEELFEPRRMKIVTYHTYERPDDGEIFVTRDVHFADSTFTNGQARAGNIRSIATSGKPLFMTWEEVEARFKELYPPRTPLTRRLMTAARHVVKISNL
jgi:hypothetical protein